jgi:hypothetical protein
MPPPDTELVSRAEIQVDAPASAVYARLLDARRWNAWRTPPLSGRFLGAVTRYSDAVSEGDRLGVLASPSVAGVLPLPTRATVTRASGGVLSFDDDALFGLASGTTSIAVRSVGWGGKRCVVTAEHTTRGPLGCITPALAKERAMARWVLDLKRATEGK